MWMKAYSYESSFYVSYATLSSMLMDLIILLGLLVIKRPYGDPNTSL